MNVSQGNNVGSSEILSTRNSSSLLRYGVALLAVGLALLVQMLLVPWFETSPDATPFLTFVAGS